jgi:hypothetical protein
VQSLQSFPFHVDGEGEEEKEKSSRVFSRKLFLLALEIKLWKKVHREQRKLCILRIFLFKWKFEFLS